ncbi:MAG: Long-chain-fatty-acid--CoA ligase [Frankiales bacterium]|nr:Long-chain-fatty-acid--CoA ligase [Frankiales bacterium]
MPGPAKSPARRPSAPPPGPSYADRPWLASYPPGVPADFDFPKIPLTRLLDDAASSFPTGTALAFLGTTITYRELKEAVDRFAAGLARLGLAKGDRVALVLPNCPQNVIAFYAALRLGAVVVQHNPLYTEAELRHQLADCGATVVVCLDRVYGSVAAVRADTALEHVITTSIADYLPTATKLKLRLPLAKAKRARAEMTASIPKGAPVTPFLSLLKGGDGARQVQLDPETDLALLQYTGGTTGASKGAMLTHYNLVSNAYMNRLWDTGATAGKEVSLAVLPLFHAYGLTVAMNATVLLGGTLVLLPRFDIDQVFAAIDEWKPTMFPGVPPIYKALADSPKVRSHDLRSIRLCVSGAMKLPTEIQDQFEKISGAALVEGYGMTETSPSTHCNPVGGTRKPGSIGLPLPGTHCKVVAQDDPSVEVPLGEPGELAIKGPQVFRGYWGREDTSGVFTDDGYVLTGDVAVMDEDGFFSIVDRKKELIIAGGFNIYPSEVEEVLFRLPGVQDAVVVGLPDKYRGETVKAYVVAAPAAGLSEGDVADHCRRELAAYKVPKVVEFRESLPRTVVGKVLRRVLLEEERAKQGAQEVPASVPGGRTRAAAAANKAPAKRAPAKTAEAAPARRAPAKKKAAAAPAAASAPVKKTPARKPTTRSAPAAEAIGPAVKKAPAKRAPARKAAEGPPPPVKTPVKARKSAAPPRRSP